VHIVVDSMKILSKFYLPKFSTLVTASRSYRACQSWRIVWDTVAFIRHTKRANDRAAASQTLLTFQLFMELPTELIHAYMKYLFTHT